MLEVLDELTCIGNSDIYFDLSLVNLGESCYDAISYELEQIADHLTMMIWDN